MAQRLTGNDKLTMTIGQSTDTAEKGMHLLLLTLLFLEEEEKEKRKKE
jgi:hypothetical protein